MPSLVQELERFGAGVFVAARGIDSRLGEGDFWRAFEEPVIIWAHGERCDDAGLESLLELVQKIPHIRRFRFTNTRVTRNGAQKIHEARPGVSVEGIPA